MIRRVCVFCGSSPGRNPLFVQAAREVGGVIARAGLGLVYGGGGNGMMGAVADAARQASQLAGSAADVAGRLSDRVLLVRPGRVQGQPQRLERERRLRPRLHRQAPLLHRHLHLAAPHGVLAGKALQRRRLDRHRGEVLDPQRAPRHQALELRRHHPLHVGEHHGDHRVVRIVVQFGDEAVDPPVVRDLPMPSERPGAEPVAIGQRLAVVERLGGHLDGGRLGTGFRQ